MEAQLSDTAFEPSVPRADATQLQEELLSRRLDAYLRAAGVTEAARRRHLSAAARNVLRARGASGTTIGAAPSWAEIIAAVDSSLATETCGVAAGAAVQSGRVTLRLEPLAAAEDAWGTPPRRRQRMRPQSLTPWRPQWQGDAAWLYRFQIRRAAQSVAACLCWLAVLIIP